MQNFNVKVKNLFSNKGGLSMIKKFVPFLALVFVGSYLAGRYDLWWVAVIYSGVLYWLFFLKK